MAQAPYDPKQAEYNKFEQYPLTSYNVIKFLMNNEDDLWKVLKYSDPDAWNKPNLSYDEKASLIYIGLPNITDKRVFLDVGQDNSWTIEACFLRVAPATLVPDTYVFGHMSIACEIYSHYKINTMTNYTARTDYATQRVIATLNGADIPDVGRLYFDYKASTQTRSMLIGAIPYKGRTTILCNYYLG